MSIRDTVRRQYAKRVDEAARHADIYKRPVEGWIVTFRKALGMSGAQLARRIGITRAAVSQAERNERCGAITLKQLEKFAAGLGGRLVYAIVPDNGRDNRPNDRIEDVLTNQARAYARSIVIRASAHMALEKQSIAAEDNQHAIDRLANELLRLMPSDFWGHR